MSKILLICEVIIYAFGMGAQGATPELKPLNYDKRVVI